MPQRWCNDFWCDTVGGKYILNLIVFNIISTVQIQCSNSVNNTVVHSKQRQSGHTLYIVVQLGTN